MYRRNDEMMKMGLANKLIYSVAINDLDAINQRLDGISQKHLDMKYGSYDNALLLATTDNKLEAIKLLLNAGATTEIKDASGCTPLAIALRNGNEQIAYLLMNYGASVCHQSNRKVSILHYAAMSCGSQMIEFLLDKGLDIDYLASNKLSVLDFTTNIHTKGNLDAAKTLVANGINREIITKAFKEACWRGNDKIADMLINAGADINVILGKKQKTPETLFWLCKHPDRLQKTKYLKTIRLLITQGFNFEQQYKFVGQILNCIGSPLQKAKQENFIEAVRLIKEGEW